MTLRALLSSLLLALMLISSAGVGFARGQAPAVGHVVLCSGHGPVTVAVDASGQPAGPQHLCPDCVVGLTATLPPIAATPEPIDRAIAGRVAEAQAQMPDRSFTGALARAPPLG